MKGYIKENDLLKIEAARKWCLENNMNYVYYLGVENININKEYSLYCV